MSTLEELHLSGVEQSVLAALVEGAEKVPMMFPAMMADGDEPQWMPIAFLADGEGMEVKGFRDPAELADLVRESDMNVSVVGFVAEAWLKVVERDSTDETDQKLLSGELRPKDAENREEAVIVTLVSKTSLLEFYREIVRKDGEPPALAAGPWRIEEDASPPSAKAWLPAVRDALV
jgi:hypothetical protein